MWLICIYNRFAYIFLFSALTLLGDRNGMQLVKKVGCWFVGGVDLSGALHVL